MNRSAAAADILEKILFSAHRSGLLNQPHKRPHESTAGREEESALARSLNATIRQTSGLLSSSRLSISISSAAVRDHRSSEEMTVCNESNIIKYSNLCLSDDPPKDCFPSLESTNNVIALSLAFQAFNIFLGLAGNLLTLLSIPYARYRRRFGFQGCHSIV